MEQYDSRNYPNYYTNPVTKTIRYSETHQSSYTLNDSGIVLKQNLKDDDIDVHYETTYPFNSYMTGYKVTSLENIIEGYFDNELLASSGRFYGSYLHQDTVYTINMDSISVSPFPPYININSSVYSSKYGSELNHSIKYYRNEVFV